MAWRRVGKKGLESSLIRALASASVGAAAGIRSTPSLDLGLKSITASVKCIHDSSFNSFIWGYRYHKVLNNEPLIRSREFLITVPACLIWTRKDNHANRPKPFKFFNCWIAHEKFMDTVKSSCQVEASISAKKIQFEQLKLSNLDGGWDLEDEKVVQAELIELEAVKISFYKQREKIHWFFTELIGRSDPYVQDCHVNVLGDLLDGILPEFGRELEREVTLR
ncbi:hypothetical protein F3Y22_tig00111942pilonHSYRG00097 [Hibiscus syriacus]|uniref:Uncharacterized protein n=1 Tax=Hibiscus syriacus TaxID=106335 RepID=A0A6A2YAS7_HIBSY|nr:hypothetical protein F3Y22_tig00111942pilonHSYRG00097 [Hibiscus syriacus]